jgi:hypothetical protein
MAIERNEFPFPFSICLFAISLWTKQPEKALSSQAGKSVILLSDTMLAQKEFQDMELRGGDSSIPPENKWTRVSNRPPSEFLADVLPHWLYVPILPRAFHVQPWLASHFTLNEIGSLGIKISRKRL